MMQTKAELKRTTEDLIKLGEEIKGKEYFYIYQMKKNRPKRSRVGGPVGRPGIKPAKKPRNSKPLYFS